MLKRSLVNRRAAYDYFLLEKFEAGLALSGQDAKAVREGRVDLTGSFIKMMGGEVFLINASLGGDARSRRLLLHKKEILAFGTQSKREGLSLIPLKLYYRKGRVKLEVALGRGKKKQDKRAALRDKDLKRTLQNWGMPGFDGPT